MQQVTGLLLKGYKAQFKGAPVSSTVAYLRQYVAGALPHNPLVTHETDARHLRDPGFLGAALRHRSARLLFTLQGRIRALRGRLGDFHAWNACLNHILALANAHVESVTYAAFARAVDGCIDPDCRRALKAMCDVFALRAIENDSMFRDDEFIAPSKAKAISRLVRDLCSELRSVALPLVAAWGVPDHILRAPIGLGSHSGVDIYREYLASVGFDV
jgi:acyl-CoA oxidase